MPVKRRVPSKRAPTSDALGPLFAIEDDDNFCADSTDLMSMNPMPPFSEMNEAQRTLYCLGEVQREVMSGGFWQFYMNSSGDCALETEAAFRRLSADKPAALVKAANAFFGRKGPPTDRHAREVAVAKLGARARDKWGALDQKFFKDGAVGALVRRYVKKHRPLLLENVNLRELRAAVKLKTKYL